MGWLTAVGMGLQLVGTLTAARGLWRTWREFSDTGEGFLDPVSIPARAAFRRFAAAADRTYRRLLRRPGRSVTAEASFSAGGVLHGLDATVRVQFRELPAEQPLADSLSELDTRTRDLMTRLATVDENAHAGLKEVRADIGDLSAQLDSAVTGLERQTRRAAIGGIRWAALGLSLVAIGTFLELVAAA